MLGREGCVARLAGIYGPGRSVLDIGCNGGFYSIEMKKRGAKPGDLVALMSATGAQTETIPPSIVLITVGSVTGVSISALFTGGLLPGIVLAIGLCAVVWYRYRNEDLSQIRRATGREILRAFVVGIPALALPFVIRYSVVGGVATATEVSTIGIVYTIVVAVLIYVGVERYDPVFQFATFVLLVAGCPTRQTPQRDLPVGVAPSASGAPVASSSRSTRRSESDAISATAMVDGRPALTVEHITRLAPEVAPG